MCHQGLMMGEYHIITYLKLQGISQKKICIETRWQNLKNS